MTSDDHFYPSSKEAWRAWLQENHDREQSVWVIFYKKDSGVPSLSWSDAVDEALCFGWIDSTKRPIDNEKFMQFFSRRKPSSTWSKINKDKVAQLIKEGKMTSAGLAIINKAKENGNWTRMDQVEALIIPEDLEAAFAKNTGTKDYFLSLTKSVKKMLLYWLASAKREETRDKRIKEIVDNAQEGTTPKQFRR